VVDVVSTMILYCIIKNITIKIITIKLSLKHVERYTCCFQLAEG
jgi:hypothetical protein